MAELEVEMIMATTHPVEAFGGIQLAQTALEELVTAMQTGTVPMVLGHDPRQPISASVLDASVREREDGHAESWARVLVDENE